MHVYLGSTNEHNTKTVNENLISAYYSNLYNLRLLFHAIPFHTIYFYFNNYATKLRNYNSIPFKSIEI